MNNCIKSIIEYNYDNPKVPTYHVHSFYPTNIIPQLLSHKYYPTIIVPQILSHPSPHIRILRDT